MLKDLIVEMLTDVVPDPVTIAEISTRSEKKVLVVRTHLQGCFVFVYAEKSDASAMLKSSYPDFGYIYDYAKMFDDNGMKLLALAAGSLDKYGEQLWDQSLIWSTVPPASIVLFAAMLKVWKKVRFREDTIATTLSSLIGKYSAQQPHLVDQQHTLKTYSIKSSMEAVDTSGEIYMMTPEIVAGEDARHRNVHTLIINHIDTVRNKILKETERVKDSLYTNKVDLSKPVEFSPEDLLKVIRY